MSDSASIATGANFRRNLIQVPLAAALYPKHADWNESMLEHEWWGKLARKTWVGLDIKFRWRRKRKEVRKTQETTKNGDYVDTREITRDTFSVPEELDLPFHIRLHWGYYMSDHTKRWKNVPWHCNEVCPTQSEPGFEPTSLYNAGFAPFSPRVSADGYWEELERQPGEFVANSRREVYYYNEDLYFGYYQDDETLPLQLDLAATYQVNVETTAPASAIQSTCADEPDTFAPLPAINELDEGTLRNLFVQISHLPELYREWPTDPAEKNYDLRTALSDNLFIRLLTDDPVSGITELATLRIPIGRPDSAVPAGAESKGMFSIGGEDYEVYTTGEYENAPPDPFNEGSPVNCSSSNGATYKEHTFPAGQHDDYNLIEDIEITEFQDPPETP